MGATPREIARWRPILTAQIGAESNFTQGVGSPAGARDIAQFMPGTAPSYGVRLGDGRIKDDIRGQVRYMLPLLRKYGAEGALRGYNAGVGAIERSKGFSETNNYVRKVLGSADQYGGLVDSAGIAPGQRRPGPAQIVMPPGVDLSGLIAQLAGRRPAPRSGGSLPAPAFAAQAVMPSTYQGFDPGQAPAPKPDELEGLLAMIATPLQMAEVQGGGQGVPGLKPSNVAPGKAVLAPGADRPGVSTNPRILRFVGQVAGMVGKKRLTIGTGTNHSQYTINGNVSNHWTGHGADIPSSGAELTRLGRAALIAAGMSPKEARAAKGGLYNINGWQIIFNTNEGGNHHDHLHVGWRGR